MVNSVPLHSGAAFFLLKNVDMCISLSAAVFALNKKKGSERKPIYLLRERRMTCSLLLLLLLQSCISKLRGDMDSCYIARGWPINKMVARVGFLTDG